MNLCDGNGHYTTVHKDHKLSALGRVTGVGKLWCRQLRHYVNFPTAVLVTTLLVASVNLHQTRQLRESVIKPPAQLRPAARSALVTGTGKQAWIRAKKLETGYLKHVTNVLQSIGYSLDGGTYSDWNILWTHEYPFNDNKLKELFLSLKPHQKVNKWPGSGYVTSKVSLATSSIKHIPKAFQLPAKQQEFKLYAESHPDMLWVQKSNKHRGIRITPVSGLDLSSANTFVQKYVDNPLIIDKKKFDIGVYTIVTSIDPLRIYIVDHEFLLRFCAEEYYPFDASNINKYVVTDDYTPIWKIPSLNKYFEQGFTAKQSFTQYLLEQGMNPTTVFSDIESTIRDVYLSKIDSIREAAKPYNHRNFFEMVRFDFVLDDKLEIYLMEVNMSPNLSSGHFPPNRLLYEQVIYNLFHLIGAASSLDHHSKLEINEQEMLAGPRDLSVQPADCVSKCEAGCRAAVCKLCYSCMTAARKLMFQEAYREHVDRRNTRRIMPPTLDPNEPEKKPDYWEKLSENDKLLHSWFSGKCKDDRNWC